VDWGADVAEACAAAACPRCAAIAVSYGDSPGIAALRHTPCAAVPSARTTKPSAKSGAAATRARQSSVAVCRLQALPQQLAYRLLVRLRRV
jgi:hypothetical protein